MCFGSGMFVQKSKNGMNGYLHTGVTLVFMVLLSASVAFGQTASIKGKILDEDSAEPVIGANVILKGTSIGTITDVDGNFILEGISSGAHHVSISFVGYTTKEISIAVTQGKSINLGSISVVSQSL